MAIIPTGNTDGFRYFPSGGRGEEKTVGEIKGICKKGVIQLFLNCSDAPETVGGAREGGRGI